MALLFGAVGFTAALLIHDYSTVCSRREVLSRYEGNSEFRSVRRDDRSYQAHVHVADVSWFRRQLGDETFSLILLPRHETNDEELARVRALFPAAQRARL